MCIAIQNSGIELGTIAQWLGAIGTISAVAVALFKDEFLRWRRRPKLNISISLHPPDCHKTQLTVDEHSIASSIRVLNCYYFRLWVRNDGRSRAERVEVFVAKIRQRNTKGSFEQLDNFLPMNLVWSAGSGGERIYIDGISPGMGKHCDIGHIIDPTFRKFINSENSKSAVPNQTIFSLDLEFKTNTLSHLLMPGSYQIDLLVAASNANPSIFTISLDLFGNWYPDESQMFAEGLKLSASDIGIKAGGRNSGNNSNLARIS